MASSSGGVSGIVYAEFGNGKRPLARNAYGRAVFRQDVILVQQFGIRRRATQNGSGCVQHFDQRRFRRFVPGDIQPGRRGRDLDGEHLVFGKRNAGIVSIVGESNGKGFGPLRQDHRTLRRQVGWLGIRFRECRIRPAAVPNEQPGEQRQDGDAPDGVGQRGAVIEHGGRLLVAGE